MPEKNSIRELASVAPRRSPLLIAGVIAVGVLILAAVGFGVWYLVLAPQSAPKTAAVQPSAVTTKPVEQVEQPPATPEEPVTVPPTGANIPAPNNTQTPAATASEAAAPTTDQAPAAVAAPAPATIAEGKDSDSDMLTDAEEALLGTNPNLKDTNGNGYDDGTEVMNLYDPLHKGAPLSGNAGIKAAAWDKYNFLLPVDWSLTTDPVQSGAAVVQTGTSAKITLLLRPNPSGQGISSWLGLQPGDSSLKPLKLKSGNQAMQTADGLTSYVALGDSVLVVSYDAGTSPTYDFRTLYAMLLNSLQLAKAK